jgi:hypothetical protein
MRAAWAAACRPTKGEAMRKSWIAVAVATATVLVLAATASAAIVRSNPGGEITMRSLGRITLNMQIFRIECRMTLRGRFFESARGTLEGELLLRPQIGQITSGSVEECTTNSTVRLLFETFFEWLIYTNGISEPRMFGLNLLNFQFLIRVPLLFECLYRVLLGLMSNGDLIGVTSITSLEVTRLEGIRNSCPIPPVVTGAWDLEPNQELRLEIEI